MKTLGDILAEVGESKRPTIVRNNGPMVTEIPQYDCWTRTFNLSIIRYAKEPSVDQSGKVLTFWEANPEHWRYRVLEGRVCSAKVNRMCVCCDDCGRSVVRFEKAYWAERRARKATDAG